MSKPFKFTLCVTIVFFLFTATACTTSKPYVHTDSEDSEMQAEDYSSQGDIESEEYSREEIYNAFIDAYDFYYSWIYGQYYIDSSKITEKNGQYSAPVFHEEIKTSDDLIKKIYSCFAKAKAEEFIAQLNPNDENGILYINCATGVGDNGIEFDTYTIEKTDNNIYILTLFMKNTFMETNIKSQIICKIENGKILFDDYKGSPLADDSDFIFMFEP